MSVQHVVILGAGPCGMSAAIALAKASSTDLDSPELRITLIELRPSLQTIGGTINLTPLAMRYLDFLGVGSDLRMQSINLDNGIDYFSLRNGRKIGNFWGGIGAIRIARHTLVESLLKTLTEEYTRTVDILWGARVIGITEENNKVHLRFEDSSTVQGDILLGCDGLHSAARKLWVEPERKETFTGRVVSMGWAESTSQIPTNLSTGESALEDTTLFLSPKNGVLLATFYEPSRSNIYFANVISMKEPDSDARDGWKLLGGDKEAVKKNIMLSYDQEQIKGLRESIAKCEDWHIYPVYVLPGQGRWCRGRVLLMGDAAHAMPPQGESTGLAIEDGILLAHVFRRRNCRTAAQLLSDFVVVRTPIIDRYYREAVWMMRYGFGERNWFTFIIQEWSIWIYLLVKRWRQNSRFSGDVRKIDLPA